ncbi:MAG TPA: hypothetical protein VG738_03245 [Chitinophagaceae bacterium]|nr:hypothetical protein [Chitinophagaceae bacterium]
MGELTMEATRVLLLREQLLQICSKVITEDDLLTMKSLIEGFLHKKEYRSDDDMPEEFGSTRYDFDEWLHDPGK